MANWKKKLNNQDRKQQQNDKKINIQFFLKTHPTFFKQIAVMLQMFLGQNDFDCFKLFKIRAMYQGCDCAANWLILANSYPNSVISEISAIQVRKCFPVMGVGLFASHEKPSNVTI